jgi:hypothetical protein
VFVLTQTRSKEDKSMPQPELIALIYAFTDQTRARQAFEAMRRIIFTHECQLSAYRYWIGSKQAGEAHFVMVVGDPATFALKDHMSQVLTHFGEPRQRLPQTWWRCSTSAIETKWDDAKGG